MPFDTKNITPARHILHDAISDHVKNSRDYYLDNRDRFDELNQASRTVFLAAEVMPELLKATESLLQILKTTFGQQEEQ